MHVLVLLSYIYLDHVHAMPREARGGYEIPETELQIDTGCHVDERNQPEDLCNFR